jgi:flagellar biosynthesis anti-sigma factor FlgM
MRIDLYNTSASEAAGEASAQPISEHSSATPAAAGEDRTTLTSDSTSVGSLVSAALQSPAVRQDQVNSLKDAISSGQYQLDPVRIASALVEDQG